MATTFQPLRHAPAYARVYAAIEARILSRELQAGDPLPAELELARQFQVNRSTVREALRLLESSGLAERAPGAKRLRVARPAGERVARGLSHALLLHEVTFLEVWEAMRLVEPEAAALAAVRRTDAQLDALRATHAVLADASVPADVAVESTVEFFRGLGEACGNTALRLAKDPLTRLLRPTLRRMIDRVPQARRRIHEAQARLLEALAARDGHAAREWMHKHIRDFRRGYEIAGISLQARIEAGGCS